jgi:hypothetical protein
MLSPSVEFNVEQVQDVDWNEEAFANLIIPSGRKVLLQSLVEAHHKELGFDDFIKGKGQGLVINLFGPPGVGSCAVHLQSSCSLFNSFPSMIRQDFLGRGNERACEATLVCRWCR